MPKTQERGFRYQKRTKEDLKERANMKGGNFDSIFLPKYKQWKPKDGKNLIRVLPPTWEKARHYGLDIFVNFSIGADNQSYLSLSKHGKGADPLEEARREAQKEGDKKLAQALNPTQRLLYWIIDRADEDAGPLLWAAPFTFDKSLANLCIDEDTKEVIYIDDPDTGRDVRFYKEGALLTTKYDPSKMKILNESFISEDEGLQKEWLDFITENPLPEVLNFHDYDHISSVFDGQAGWKDEEAEAEPAPSRRRAAPNSEDEPPARGRRVSQRDSDPEDASEDEPAAPVSRRRRPDPDTETTVMPRGRKRAVAESEPDDEGDAPPPPTRSRHGTTEPKEEAGGSLRERLARNRRSAPADED